MIIPRRVAALTMAATITAGALFGLTACTGAPAGSSSPSATAGTGGSASEDETGDGGQSTEDACALVQQTITDATADFEGAGEEDPAAVVDAMGAAAEKIAATSSQITNDQVAAILPSLQDMFAQASEVMAAVVDGDASKLDDLTALGGSFQETSEAFQKVCAP